MNDLAVPMPYRRSRIVGVCCGLLALIVLVATASSVGVTWDEPIYAVAAENAARWFGTLVAEGPAVAFDQVPFGIGWGLVNEHPPLFRIVNAVGWTLTREMLPAPLSHRIGTIFFSALVIGVVAAATARRAGALAGVFAAAALLAMPRLFFHEHLAALDFPLAGMWFLATLAFCRAVCALRWWSPLLIGLALGLALLTKINAVLLLPFWGLWLLLRRRDLRAIGSLVLALPVALIVVVAGWPWIWRDAVAGLTGWVQFFRVHYEIRQWFAGRLFVQTPWYLPEVMVGITAPIPLLALAVLGPIWEGRVQRARLSDWTLLQLLGIAISLGYYMLPITAIHDQDRLLLPAFIHLAILAGSGFGRLAAWLARWIAARTAAKAAPFIAGVALGTALLAPGAVAIARLHPYELSYYNAFVGGVSGAALRGMETTYYASAYGHFLPVLNELPSGSRVWVMPNSYDVLYYYQRAGLLRDDLVMLRPWGWGSFFDDSGALSDVGGIDAGDYALIDRRQTTFNDTIPENAIQLSWAASQPEIARLEKDGVLLAALYGR